MEKGERNKEREVGVRKGAGKGELDTLSTLQTRPNTA